MQDEPFRLPTVWPRPHDSGAADRLIERFGDIGRAEGRLAASPAVTALLRSLGGNSPYLADLAVRESATLRAIVATGPDQVVAAALNELASVTPQTRRDRVAAAMRRAKRVVALATAIADIGGIWPLERITGTLSDLAEATLWLAMAHLLRVAHDSGELRLPDPTDPTRGGGFTVLVRCGPRAALRPGSANIHGT
jgi:glutamate-ammonia-ligase adenylyltransferase